ncbi:MAG: methyltransferase domain-containing protein [Rhizobiaceae bacterium]|nr:methyltransferase domain-containing protein [Rhizobiaceae bacterium]
MPPSARFWDRIANRYAKRPVADEATYQKKLQMTREYLEPHMRVFEFGCGTGSTALTHSPHVAYVRATDISAKMIDIAKSKAREAGVKNVEFEQSDIESIAASSAKYDVVLGLSILHLLDDRDAVVSTIYDMLEPGGIFVSSTACLGDHMKIFKFIAPLGRFFGILPILSVFTTQDLVGCIEDSGFEIETKWSPGKNKGVFIIARKPL